MFFHILRILPFSYNVSIPQRQCCSSDLIRFRVWGVFFTFFFVKPYGEIVKGFLKLCRGGIIFIEFYLSPLFKYKCALWIKKQYYIYFSVKCFQLMHSAHSKQNFESIINLYFCQICLIIDHLFTLQQPPCFRLSVLTMLAFCAFIAGQSSDPLKGRISLT